MWSAIASLLGGFFSGPLKQISNDLKEAYQSKLAAANDAERIAADERINTLEARKSIILAAQSDPLERLVRIGFALPFVIYNAKLLIWDKVLGFGITDGLSPELTQLMWIVVGGYFLDTTVKRIFKR